MPKTSWQPEPAADLPDGLLLFDGYCHICSGSVRFAILRDTSHQFTYVPCQSPWGYELMARFGIDPDFPETFGFVDKGRMLFKSDAAIASAARLPWWGWVRIFTIVPRTIRDALYDFTARNRYRWFGKRTVCMALPGGVTARFLTEAPAKP
jgi:predicted DCC family thiol-disulfide oxidoreductase YuxK